MKLASLYKVLGSMGLKNDVDPSKSFMSSYVAYEVHL